MEVKDAHGRRWFVQVELSASSGGTAELKTWAMASSARFTPDPGSAAPPRPFGRHPLEASAGLGAGGAPPSFGFLAPRPSPRGEPDV